MGFLGLSSKSEYVSDEALSKLRLYKYAAVDKSYLSHYILRHYWNACVSLFPLWMAPNLITLCGLGFMVFNFFCVLYYIPDLETPAAPWLYYSFAAGIWLYSTFDNVDGKQARRTGSSSPLGELFDHGCDALNCSIGSIVQAAGMGMGLSWYTVHLAAMTTIPFYLSTWEEYHTGVLYLGVFNGPTEGLVLSCLCNVLSGIYGPHIWRAPLSNILGELTPSFLPKDTSPADVIFLSMYLIIAFVHSPACFIAVRKACQEKNKNYATTLLQLSSMALYVVCIYFWLASPYSVMLHEHLILFIITVGIVFGRMATKIILSHVTKSEFPMFTVLLIPIVVGSIAVNAPNWFDTQPLLTPSTEYYYLIAFFVFASVAYTHWALLVIDRFCTFLGIHCLTIPYKKHQD
ncbi:Choline/ethanolaminephosphotransferase [Basidiobolus meristosporus CBS 931.73]|uniref:Choline/ethanolaminephosphotransferase n=1 Tax=Basidiobolus meristosporus CBS 931.73 TaxID=1314790 RepID=A0A1Y1XZV3_9FUNG|nr:Choline/ethanolaminephosphotransferase [Basidiobolus meristosporus CBS 931.73]|eukprot:ORX91271.1 Choline/ethanolaminephosphotransferase [Basidiobolus meristosporus CBS 931.73]